MNVSERSSHSARGFVSLCSTPPTPFSTARSTSTSSPPQQPLPTTRWRWTPRRTDAVHGGSGREGCGERMELTHGTLCRPATPLQSGWAKNAIAWIDLMRYLGARGIELKGGELKSNGAYSTTTYNDGSPSPFFFFFLCATYGQRREWLKLLY